MDFTLEKVNLPLQPFRVFVHYKNISRLYLRVISADQRIKDQLEMQASDDKYWPLITTAPSVKSWQQSLPLTSDYQNHGVEIRTDGLETGEYIRVGSSKVHKTDVRVIAATNKDLLDQVHSGKFREDLYYRLSTVPIRVPALHDRKEDITLLFRKFAVDFAEKYLKGGAFAGTFTWWRIVGFAFCVLSILWMTGRLDFNFLGTIVQGPGH